MIQTNPSTSRARRLLTIALTLLIGVRLAPAQEPTKNKPDAVRTLVQKYVDRQEIAGAVILVLHHGQPVCFEALGMADREAKKTMTQDTIFRIASMTKPITSAAAMMLVEEGKLRLEDPVSKYLPEFEHMTVLVPTKGSKDGEKGPPLLKAHRPITLRHLLTHTSGITYRLSNRPHLAKLYAEAGVSDGLVETAGTIEDNVKRLAKLPLLHQPGTAWEYGLNIDVLGRVIEVASGKTLDEFFRQRIFGPLAMHDTSFIVPKEKRSRLAALYTLSDQKTLRRVGDGPIMAGSFVYSATYCTADNSRYYSGGAGLVSTAHDYGRFLQMLLGRGQLDGKRLLKPETVEQLTRNQIGDLQIPFQIHGDGFGYGFGIVTGREQPPLPASRGAYSWGGIFNTFFWVDPQEQLIGIVLTQLYPFGHLSLWKDFQAKVYQQLSASKGRAQGTSREPSDHALPRIRISEVTIHGDMDCFKVETPSATYLYGKKGAGFASIFDKHGHDWISYRPGDKAKGEYRGLPKCGQPTKFFHCGYGYGQYKTDNVFVSKVTLREADHVRIRSETLDQKSACIWDFCPTHATLTLLRIDLPTFWFLYEGTPGGHLDPNEDFVIRPDGRKTSLNEPWSEVVPWICFGSRATPVGFVCINHQEPEKGQTDSYVSWPFVKEKDGSFQDMTVFGFGRKGYKELVQHVPDLTRLPARFSIGFVNKANQATAKALYDELGRIPAGSESSPTQPSKTDLNLLRQVAMNNGGNAQRGKALFDSAKTKCATCHKVHEQGREIGPDLSLIGGKFDRTHLIEAILDPSAEILQGYHATILETKAGRVITGIVKSESPTAITLLDAEGKQLIVLRDDIESRAVSKVSLMPEGLADPLTPAEFTDLIAYLTTLRTGPAPTPGEVSSATLTLPEGFKADMLAAGFTGATALEVAPAGRIFICEQTGSLRVIKDGKLLAEPFVKLPVEATWERGLIGVTVAPDFPKGPYVFVCYVAAKPYPHHVVSRFTAIGDVAEPGSERILLEGDDQTKLGGTVPAGHQGGALHFGKDGKLYTAIGDQTAGEPAQRFDTFQGKLLRINPDGSIPEDNPFLCTTAGKYRSIWALGLRNPFTFAVQPETGRLFINDVGGIAEEINEGIAGANYGWPTVEHGPTADPRFRGPIHYYPTACITGGAFAPMDLRWPKEYRGRYFFGDFNHGWIKTIDPAQPAVAKPFATGLRRPVDLRFAREDSLYVLLRDAWVMDRHFKGGTGVLLRIRYTGTFLP